MPAQTRRSRPRHGALLPPTGNRVDSCVSTSTRTPSAARRASSKLSARSSPRTRLSVYPDYAAYDERLSSFFRVASDNILLTNGTDEAIQVLINTYVDDGDEVLVLARPTPCTAFTLKSPARTSSKSTTYPQLLTSPERPPRRHHAPTRAILIANPNNPTGTAIDLERNRMYSQSRAERRRSDRRSLLRVLRRHRARPASTHYPNLFVSRTFSKVYGMAAMRMGCLFSQAANIQYLHKAQSPYSVNMLAAMAAEAAVQDTEYISNYVTEALAARELLRAGLERLGIAQAPSSANFILGYFGDRAIEVRDALREKAILVRDRSYEIPGGVRITVGTREQARRVLEELERIW